MPGIKQRLLRPVVLVGAVILGTAGPAWAQSRPLVTEDPETVGPGQILFEAGLDYNREAQFPASGLKGNLWRIGTFGLSIGVSSIAELQLDGGLRNKLAIRETFSAPLAHMLTLEGDSTSDVEDFVVGAKVRFLSEGVTRPAMAVRFATRLPNAGNESGLGLDTTDFAFGLALAKTVESIRVASNLGFAILGDPARGDRQNDVFTYGVSIARAVRTGLEVVAEVNGRANTRSGQVIAGLESRSVMRVGSRYTRGPVRVDGAFLFGIAERDPTWGFTTGLTWVFNAFTLK
jgi:hypothetical protein